MENQPNAMPQADSGSGNGKKVWIKPQVELISVASGPLPNFPEGISTPSSFQTGTS